MMRTRRARVVVAGLLTAALALAPVVEAVPVGAQTIPSTAGCPTLPADDIWNTPVDTLPVDPASDAYDRDDRRGRRLPSRLRLRPVRGRRPSASRTWSSPPTRRRVAVSFLYADESDPGPYPIPPDAPDRGWPERRGRPPRAGRGQRLPAPCTSCSTPSRGTTAAGRPTPARSSTCARPRCGPTAGPLPMPPACRSCPGLVRYDEVAAGEIRHALRFTVPDTRREYVWPARHFASDEEDAALPADGPAVPPAGRLRLSAASRRRCRSSSGRSRRTA